MANLISPLFLFMFNFVDIGTNSLKKEASQHQSDKQEASFKDTHMEKAPSNKTPLLSESMNMAVWVVGTSNQLFVRLGGWYIKSTLCTRLLN